MTLNGKSRINICLLFSGVSVVFGLSGCQGPVQTYPGPKLPRSKVAILDSFPYYKKDIIGIGIDDHYYGAIWTGRASMLPGKHEIVWAIKEPRGNFTYRGHGILNARAGEYYKICTDYELTGERFELEGRVFARVKSYSTTIGCRHKGDWIEWEDHIKEPRESNTIFLTPPEKPIDFDPPSGISGI